MHSDAKRMDNFVEGCDIKKGFAGNKRKLDKLAAAKCLYLVLSIKLLKQDQLQYFTFIKAR